MANHNNISARAKRWGGCLLVPFAMLLAAPASAIDVHVSSDTITQGYQLISSSGDVLKRSRIHQLLGLSVLDMKGDSTNSISFVTSMRFDSDFGITETEQDAIEQLRNHHFSLMYMYFDFNGIADMLDIRVGRQLLIDDMDFTMMDGLRLGVHIRQAHIGVEIVGGLEAKNAGALELITETQLEADGDGAFDGAIDEELGIVVGGAVFLDGLRDHHGRVGYRRIMTPDGDVDAEKVFANYHYRIIPQLHIQLGWAWDFVINDISDIRAQIRSPHIADFLDIELSYLRLVPSFEGSSIFNVFSTEPMNDIDTRFRFHIARGVSAYIGGYVRLFGNEKDADDTVEDDGLKDFGGRIGGRVKLGRTGRIGLDASYQTGYGDMAVVDLHGGYGFLDDTLRIDSRITTVVFEDAVQERLSATSFGALVGVSYRIKHMARFQVVGEVNTNRIEELQFRMFGLVDLDFWL